MVGECGLTDFTAIRVVMNFFALWCTQCAAELPVFNADVGILIATHRR
jgi:hypothetical protein